MTTLAPPDQVLAAVAAAVPGWYGDGARLEPGGSERRSWSFHLLPSVVTPERRIHLVVKVPLWDEAPDLASALAEGPQPSTRAEFEALRAIEAMVDRSGDETLAAVRPVGYLPEVNAVVTELADAVPLQSLRGAAAVAAGRAVGRWLRRFHDEVGGAADEPLEPSAISPELDDLKTRARRLGAAVDAVVRLQRDAARLTGRRVRLGITHGDLGPSNVLVDSRSRVAVIDPNLVPGPVAADSAKLAVALRTGRSRLMLGNGLGGRLHPIEAAVLQGCGSTADELYLFLRRVAAVRRWLEVEEAGTGIRALAMPAARRVLRSEAR